MFNLKSNIVFVLVITLLGIGMLSQTRGVKHIHFLQKSPIRVSVSTYLSPPASSESSGCFLDTIEKMITTLKGKVDDYSVLCGLNSNANVQMLFNVANVLGSLQGKLAKDSKFSLSDSDKNTLKTQGTNVFDEINSSSKLTDESLVEVLQKLQDIWENIAKSNKYPLFFKNNGWELVLFTQSLSFIKEAYGQLTSTFCIPVTKKTIDIFETSVVDVIDKEPPLIQKEIVDNRITIDPMGFNYGGYALAFWVKEDNSKLINPIKILQGFLDNKEILSFSIADGSIIHNLVIAGKTMFIRENPACSEYAFVLLTIEKDCENYKITLTIRLSHSNLRFVTKTEQFPAEKIENLQITLINKAALAPMLFTNLIISEVNEKRILNNMLTVFEDNIIAELNQCKKLNQNCLYYSSENLCQVCSDGKFLFQNKCVVKCPDGTYQDEEFECQSCTDQCEQCQDINTCAVCLNGTNLFNGTCIQDCPSNLYAFEGKCVSCDPLCTKCLNETICDKCLPPALLYQGKCYNNCPDHTIGDIIEGKCIDCSLGCNKCSSPNNCIECLDGYYNLNGKCVKTCGNGFRADDGTKMCIKCIDNCKECNNNSECIICNDSFFLSVDKKCVSHCDESQVSFKNVCIDCTDKANCLICDPNNVGTCQKCKLPKVLKDGKCLNSCGDFYYKTEDNTCVPCKNNCKQCTKDKCVQCESGNFLFEDEKCICSCPYGYINSESVCIKCTDTSCKKCLETNTDVCTSCYSPQVLKEGDCVDNCGDNYFLNNDHCDKCINGCSTCFDSFTCITCDSDHYMKGSICVTDCGKGMKSNALRICEPCTVGNCAECDSDKTICDICIEGKVLFNNQCFDKCPLGSFLSMNSTICQKCSVHCLDCTDGDTCRQCENNYVLQGKTCQTICNDGFYPDNKNSCIQCSNNKCKKCPSSPSICTDCIEDLLLFNGECVNSCPQGTYQKGKECIKCQVPCSSCSSSDSCTSCITPFVLQDVKCLDNCNSGYAQVSNVCQKCKDDNCDKCDPNNLDCCIKPTLNHVLDNCDVVDNCPDGKYADTNQVCQDCLTNCNKCDDSPTCDQCKNGFYLKNGNSCVQSCGEGFIESNGKCVPCSSQCNKCKIDNLTCCTSCKDNQFSLNCECLSKCPNKYYTNGDHCSPCLVNDCAECINDGQTCTKCSDGYALFEGKCIPLPCPAKTVESNGKCDKCLVDNCESCLQSTQTCDKCLNSYVLVDAYNCKTTCPEKTFRNLIANSDNYYYCEDCPQHCHTCKNKDVCFTCEENYVLQDLVCQKNCKPGYYVSDGICVSCTTDNCNDCSPNNRCQICNDPFFLDRNIPNCYAQCLEGKFGDTFSKECKDCPLNCKKCSDKLTCDECHPSFYLSPNKQECTDQCPPQTANIDGKCTLCQTHEHCLKCNSDLTTCVQCEANFFLKNNECVVTCGDGYYLDNEKCLPCHSTCKKCKNADQCDECFDKNYLLNQDCVTACPPGYYQNTKECTPCSINCDQCTSDSCLYCKKGYLENGKCVDKCSTGYYLAIDKCFLCSQNCVQCNCKNSCVQCAPGFYLSNGICVNHCPEGEMPIDMKCTKCTDNCKTCGSTIDQCSQCQSGYYKFNGECLSDCPAGFYEDKDKCSPCMTHCDQCIDNLTCDYCSKGFAYYSINNINRCDPQCPEGYTIIDRKCVKCSANNCKSCDLTIEKCSQCTDSTVLYKEKCIKECPSNTFIEIKECKDCPTQCEKCSDITTCSKCSPGYFLEKKQCVSKCDDGMVPVNQECKECLTEDCLICNSSDLSYCTKCEKELLVKINGENKTVCVENCGDGYYIDNFECKKCNNDYCKECSNSDRCTKCISGKVLQGKVCQDKCNDFFVERNGECIECKDDNCLICDNISLDKCTKCNLPFILQDNICVIQCNTGKYLVDSISQKHCENCIDNCDICSNSNTCDKCTSPFVLLNGQCQKQCDPGYINSNGVCKKCTQNDCLICPDTNVDNCLKCKPDFFLNADSICVKDCGLGYYGVNDVCKKCIDEQCLSCAPENVCNKCPNDKYISKGKCVNSCPLSTYVDLNNECQPCSDSSCRVCLATDPGYCKQCLVGFLYENKCITQCPEGTFVNSQNQCQKCSSHCKKCIDEQTCLSCNDPFLLTKQNTCTDICDSGFVAIGDKCAQCNDLKCVQCSTTDVTICEECEPTSFLYKGKCLPDCPNGTFVSGRNCIDCESNCQTCTDQFKCLLCYPPFVEFKEDCLSTCPINWVMVGTTCVQCKDEKCNKCADNLTFCNDCQPPLLNDQGKCIKNCEIGFYYNEDKKKCDYCSNGCSICQDSTKCITCDTNHVLMPETGICVTQCPNGYYKDTTTNSCLKCDNQSCQKCDISPNSCTECPINMLKIVDSKNIVNCVDKCPDKYYQQNNTCVNCVAPCNLCKDQLTCINCISPFKLDNNTCLSECPDKTAERNGECFACADANCTHCDPNNLAKCLKCEAPSILFKDNCIDHCPPHFYLTNTTACMQCPCTCGTCDAYQCLTCANGLYFQENTTNCVNCVAPNTIHQDTCITCKIQGCMKCSNEDPNVCDLCQADYVYFNNKCLAECPSGYYKSGSTCVLCQDTCLECRGINQCSKCQEGKIKYNGQCIDQCPEHFHNNKGICEACSQPKCIHCDPTADQCLICKDSPLLDGKCVDVCPDGYTLTADKCTKCSSSCKKCDLTQCFECISGKYILGNQCVADCGDGFYNDGKTCISCSDSNCLSCKDSKTCLKCKNDTFLNLITMTCSVTCPDGYYGNKDTRECTKCSDHCAICDADKCLACTEAYAFFNDKCVLPCPNGYTSVNQICVKCTQENCINCEVHKSDICINCKTFLNNGVCVDECPKGSFSLDKKCIQCDAKCDVCQDEKTCIQCKDEFALSDGQCLNKCADGKVKKEGKCVSCGDENCKQCTTDINKCISCYPPYVLYKDQCIKECPIGTFKDQELNQCVECSHTCAQCSKDQCQQCNPGYYLFNGQCIVHCPDGFYEDCTPETRKCKPCNEACETCILGTNLNCLACSKGYFFLNNVCIQPSDCPTGTYFDGTTCEKCNIQYCLTCSSKDNCLKCNRGFVLQDGKCVDKQTLTPIIQDFTLVSPYTSSKVDLKTKETFQISDYQGTGVGSPDVTLSFYVRLLSPKIEANSNIITILNSQMSSYNFKFMIDATDSKCKMVIEDSSTLSFTLPIESCTYKDLFDWKFYSINLSQNGVDFIARVNTIDSTGKIIEYSLKVPSNSRSNVLEPSALIVLNQYNTSNISYHIGKLMIMDYYPSESQLIALSKLLPSKCDYFCTSCKNVCISCNNGILPVEDRCTSNFFNINQGNPVYFEGVSASLSFRDQLTHDLLVSDAYGMTTWFYVKNTTTENQTLYQAHFNAAVDKYQYLKVEINKGSLFIDGVQVTNSQFTPNQWYFLFVANLKDNAHVIIRDINKNDIDVVIQLPYFIRHYDDFIYEFGKNFKGSLFNTKIYINNLPSKEDLEAEFNKLHCPDNCINCTDDLKCSLCKNGFELTSSSVCIEKIMLIPSILIENIVDIWNKDIKSYPISTSSPIFTISLMIRKKTHSNINTIAQKHNLIGYYMTNSTDVKPLLTETLTKEYESEFTLMGDNETKAWTHDFTEEVYDFIQIIMVINQTTKKITFSSFDFSIKKSIELTTDFVNEIDTLVLGDQFGYEINMEFSNVRLFEGLLPNKQLLSIQQAPVPCDAACLNCNWSNGKCNTCFGNVDSVEGECDSPMFGYNVGSLYGYQTFTQLPDTQDYKFLIKNYQQVNVNADKYSVYFVAKFYRWIEGVKYRIGCVINDSYRLVTPLNNRGKNLMCFDVYVKNGKGQIEMAINDGGDFVNIPIQGITITTLQWITAYIGVNSHDKTLKYGFLTDNNIKTIITGEYKFIHVPEKIQESAGVTLYGVFDNLDTKLYAPPEILIEHFYIYPYNGYTNDDLTMMMKVNEIRPNPKCSEGCKICAWEKDEATCIECNKGYTTSAMDEEDNIYQCVPVSFTYMEFNDGIITEPTNYKIKDSSIFNSDFGLSFKILKNYLYYNYNENRLRTIIKIQSLEIGFLKQSCYLSTPTSPQLLEIPFNDVFNSWNEVFLYKTGDTIQITIRQGTYTKTVQASDSSFKSIDSSLININPQNSEVYLANFVLSSLNLVNMSQSTQSIGFETCGLDCAYCEMGECKVCSLGVNSSNKCNQAKVQLTPVFNSPDSSGLVAQYDLFEAMNSKKYIRVDQFEFEFNVELTERTDKALLLSINDATATQSIKIYMDSNKNQLTIETMPPSATAVKETYTLTLPNPTNTLFNFIGLSYNKGKLTVVYAENKDNLSTLDITLKNPIAVLTHNTVANFFSSKPLKLTNLSFFYEQSKTLDQLKTKATKRTSSIQADCLIGTPITCTQCSDQSIIKSGICLPKTLIGYYSQLAEYTQVGMFNSNELISKYKNVPVLSSFMLSFNMRITSLLKGKLGILAITSQDNTALITFDYIPTSDTLLITIPFLNQSVNVTPVQSKLKEHFEWIFLSMTYSITDGAILVVLNDKDDQQITKTSTNINTNQSIDPSELNFDFFYSDHLEGSFEYQGVVFVPNANFSETDLGKYYIKTIQECKVGCHDCSQGFCVEPVTKPFDFSSRYQSTTGKLFNQIDSTTKKNYAFNKYEITFEVDKDTFNQALYTANNHELFLLTDEVTSNNQKLLISNTIPSKALNEGFSVQLVDDTLIFNKPMLPWSPHEPTTYAITLETSPLQTNLYVSIIIDAEENTMKILLTYNLKSYFYDVNSIGDQLVPAISFSTLLYSHPAMKQFTININAPSFEYDLKNTKNNIDLNCVSENQDQHCPKCQSKFKLFGAGCNLYINENLPKL